jgi:hypothetical protein
MMTTIGCGLIWFVIVLTFAGAWYPPLLWGVPVLLILFLGFQVLRWAIPPEGKSKESRSSSIAP